jgi:signal transduction histidine kinase
VLVNLIDNAVKYSPGGANVELRVGIEGEHVVARVSDRGVGVPPEHVAHLFEPFYRARPGVASGLGLGLYVSDAVAKGHGGTLTFEPRPGGGSTFVLRLPLRRAIQRESPHPVRADAGMASATQRSANVE